MSEEALGGIDIQSTNESKEGPSEQDIAQVEAAREQGKKVAQQIQSSKQVNNKIANFLAFLLKKLDNDKIMHLLYQVFFKVKNQKENVSYLRKSVNNVVIVGIFVPFYLDEAKEYGVEPFFSKIYNLNEHINIEKYMEYLKALSRSYHDNVPLDKGEFLNLLLEIILNYKLVTIKEVDEEQERQHIFNSIEKKLFG